VRALCCAASPPTLPLPAGPITSWAYLPMLLVLNAAVEVFYA
jgi:hypothetical protein